MANFIGTTVYIMQNHVFFWGCPIFRQNPICKQPSLEEIFKSKSLDGRLSHLVCSCSLACSCWGLVTAGSLSPLVFCMFLVQDIKVIFVHYLGLEVLKLFLEQIPPSLFRLRNRFVDQYLLLT